MALGYCIGRHRFNGRRPAFSRAGQPLLHPGETLYAFVPTTNSGGKARVEGCGLNQASVAADRQVGWRETGASPV